MAAELKWPISCSQFFFEENERTPKPFWHWREWSQEKQAFVFVLDAPLEIFFNKFLQGCQIQ